MVMVLAFSLLGWSASPGSNDNWEWADDFNHEIIPPQPRNWACPEEEEYYLTHGRYRNLFDYLSIIEYGFFVASGLRFSEFQAKRAAGMTLKEISVLFGFNVVNIPGHGYHDIGYDFVYFNDLPLMYYETHHAFDPLFEVWIGDEHDHQIWDSVIVNPEPIVNWACPCEEEYYMTHGRLRNLADYLSLFEYEVFAASGLRLTEFLAKRAAGMTLRDISAITSPTRTYVFEYGYVDFECDIFYFYDLPIVYDEEWLDDDAMRNSYLLTPHSTPILTLSLGTVTHESVSALGMISNPGGLVIAERGFWIRRHNQVQQREVLVTGASFFPATIMGLTSGSRYYIRSIARAHGMTGAWQSDMQSFYTLPNNNVVIARPSAPQNVRPSAGPGTHQVTISWSPPQSLGGASSVTYQVSRDNFISWSTVSGALSHTFLSVPAGQHTFWVRAVNSAGAGPSVSVQGSPLLPVPTPAPTPTPSPTITRTVTFNPNGGAGGPGTIQVLNNGRVPVNTLATEPTRAGHRFTGWFTAQTGGTQVTHNTVVTSNVTFWARWVPNLAFSPSNIAPWNDTTWNVPSWQDTRSAVVNTGQASWSWSQNPESRGWLEVFGTGVPGTALQLRALQNNSGVRRNASVVVSAGGTVRTLIVSQAPVLTQTRGHKVFMNYNRSFYMDVFNSATTTIVENAPANIVRRPIWYLVHIVDNDFAIRNDTTGRYLTETSGVLRHEVRISGIGTNYNNRQRWSLIQQTDGSYRVRSASNTNLYIANSPSLALTLFANHSSHRWWIENIWHIDNYGWYEEWFGFWPGDIYIWVEPVPVQQAPGFTFIQRMLDAQRAWTNELDITFRNVDDMGHPNDRNRANIRAYGGDREAIQARFDRTTPFSPTNERYGVYMFRGGLAGHAGTIQVGGVTRHVHRFGGTGLNAMLIGVFSNSGLLYTFDSHNIEFATMTAMHELGHALGYFGHSPNASDVMTGTVPMWQSTPNETLNPAEVEHLRQIYRQFRTGR